MLNKEISIRPVRNEMERAATIAYISGHMQKKHGAFPPPGKTPPCIIVAMEESEIVGSVAIQFGTKNAPLQIEELFSFDPIAIPFPYARESTVYLSRWNSSRPGIGNSIWLAGSIYAMKQGACHASLTMKEALMERDRDFQRIWHPIPGAKVRSENIAESERAFFLSDLPPRPWIGIIEKQVNDLLTTTACIRENTPIRFDL